MKFNNKKAIIFDLDGTLINSTPDLALAINHMLESLNHKPFDESIIDRWVGNGALVLVQRALSGDVDIDDGLDDDYIQNALDIFLKFYGDNLSVKTTLYPNVFNTLKLLKSKGYHLAIITNKPYLFIEPILKSLNILKFFDYYIGGDSLVEKKPNPLPLLHVCERLNLSTKESIMVGDSKNDILAGNSCSMDTIGVTYGYNYGEDIESYNPSVVIDNFGEILELL